ncbi:MAG: hypothetical protein ACI9MR_000511 [Myxococcota bacterium]|jgi:hypothetical protein
MDFETYAAGFEARLEPSKYKTNKQIPLANGETGEITAHRTSFTWKGLVWLSHHLVLTQKENPTPEDFKTLFDASFKFGKKVNSVPLPRGFQFGYLVVPIIAAHSFDQAALDYVTSAPSKHFSLFEFPVLVDLKTGKAHYFEKTGMWGAAFFSDLRKIAATYVDGAEKAEA